MKKYIIRTLLPVLAFVAAAACGKTDETAGPEAPAKELVTIRVCVPEDATRVALTPDGKGLHTAWQEGDCIRVVSGSQSEVFTIKPGFTDHEAEFTGNAVDGSSFDILFPGTETSVSGAAAGAFAAQTQDGNGDTGHLKYAAALCGVDSYEEITFNSSWASEHGGSLLVAGTLRLVATLPAGVTTVDNVALSFGGTSFPLELKNVDVSASSQVLTAYIMLPWGDVTLPAGVPVEIAVRGTDKSVYSFSFKPSEDKTLVAGHVSNITVNSGFAELPFAGGSGTQTDPWLLANKKHMKNMRSHLENGAVKYFELIGDVDLEYENWTPLNNAAPYGNGIFLEGNGHTVKNLVCNSSNAYASFAGVLNGSVQNVVFDGADIAGGNRSAGVLAGFIGSGDTIFGSCSGVTVKNSRVTGDTNRLGGLAGYVRKTSAPIADCHVLNTTVSSSAERVGGLVGQIDNGCKATGCSAEDVTVSGTINIGGLIGVGYGEITDCTSSGSVSSINTASNKDIGLGGLVGYFENGFISKCSSSVNIKQTSNGRDIGGLVGKMLSATLEKSFATGNISGIQRNVGGLVGLVSLNSGKAVIRDCYCTGDVVGDAYSGGFLGLQEKGSTEISNCYSTSKVSGKFAMGGLIGVIGSADLSMSNCAAWNGTINASSHGSSNWSSAAVAGVTFPTCTLTDNYRNPSMSLTAYWVPAADYAHANVSSAHPLVTQAGTETTATSTASGQPGYPQFPYHGKVEAGKTLSQLASTTLGWDSSVWDFSGELPALK